MLSHHPISTRTNTLLPYSTLFRPAAACFQRSKLLRDMPQKILLGDPEYGALLTIILGAGDRRHADDRHCHDERKSHAFHSNDHFDTPTICLAQTNPIAA